MVNAFLSEIELIQDPSIREFVELCLEHAPEYVFNDCPSSSSGKYHPEDELGGDGCVVHTKRVVKMVGLLTSGMNNFRQQDEAIAAALIHDLRKQGVEKTGHTVSNHPDLAAAMVMEVAVANPHVLDGDVVDSLYDAVGYHYGPWSSGEWSCSDFYSEVDRLSAVVHAADFLASRKEIGSKLAV